MFILLPPSEGKHGPSTGRALDLDALPFPELAGPRGRVLDALVTMCRKDPTAAARILGLGPTQGHEVSSNARLPSAPCAPAIDVYTGVLYEALDAAMITGAARRRLNASVLIASALFGFIGPRDRIPAYRLSGNSVIPALGSLADVWRPVLSGVLGQTRGPILDLRSSAYATLGPVPASAAPRTLIGRVLLEERGRRTIVSHHNKATKGTLVRALVTAGPLPRTTNGVLEAIASLGLGVELHEPTRADRPARLDIIVTDL